MSATADIPKFALGAQMRLCARCGLAQAVPALTLDQRACCAGCGQTIVNPRSELRGPSRTAAVAAAALILYPLAVSLPILRIEQLARVRETSVLDGIASLFAHGQWLVGIVILLCSVVIPLTKLLALFALTWPGGGFPQRHRQLTHRVIEWTGRWGMLDVLLVAVLVAAMKLGDLVEIAPGPGAVAFTCVVVLSMIASGCLPRTTMK